MVYWRKLRKVRMSQQALVDDLLVVSIVCWQGEKPTSSDGTGGDAAAAPSPASPGGAGGAAAPGVVSLTRPEDFESALQHALEVMTAEVSDRNSGTLICSVRQRRRRAVFG